MEDIGFTKSQLFFVSQPFTVYEVDFLNLDMILDGFKTGNHSVLDIFSLFSWSFQKVGCSTQILTIFSDYDFLL